MRPCSRRESLVYIKRESSVLGVAVFGNGAWASAALRCEQILSAAFPQLPFFAHDDAGTGADVVLGGGRQYAYAARRTQKRIETVYAEGVPDRTVNGTVVVAALVAYKHQLRLHTAAQQQAEAPHKLAYLVPLLSHGAEDDGQIAGNTVLPQALLCVKGGIGTQPEMQRKDVVHCLCDLTLAEVQHRGVGGDHAAVLGGTRRKHMLCALEGALLRVGKADAKAH